MDSGGKLCKQIPYDTRAILVIMVTVLDMLFNRHYPNPTVTLIGQKNDLYICNVLLRDVTVSNVAI